VLLLLDTDVWLWNVEGHARRIGRHSRTLLARAESEQAVRISSASVFEVAALYTEGRLRLARPVEQWIEAALDVMRAHLAPVSAGIAVDAGLIPRAALADPLDRLLVATARQLTATLLTGDARILDYAAQTGQVHVSDARR
jgi:PIN domain nuclease of toxin-antitoxin system